jgi:hypothetical protein
MLDERVRTVSYDDRKAFESHEGHERVASGFALLVIALRHDLQIASVLNLHIWPKSPHFLRFASVWFEASESARQFSHRFSSAAKLGQIEGSFRLETKPLRVARADVPGRIDLGQTSGWPLGQFGLWLPATRRTEWNRS